MDKRWPACNRGTCAADGFGRGRTALSAESIAAARGLPRGLPVCPDDGCDMLPAPPSARCAMQVAVFSAKPYDVHFLRERNATHAHDLRFYDARLEADTAPLAHGYQGVCAFVNDRLDRETLTALAAGGTRILAMRCAGFNNVDLKAAADLGIVVARVPAYSPHAVAEHTVAMMLTLNRQIHRAWNRVRENNFALDGLLGFDVHGCTAGVIGTGSIGRIVARTLRLGFGCEVLAFDVRRDEELQAIGVHYAQVSEIAARSDIITLHCPLTPQTRHIINAGLIEAMKPGVMLINTSRGALMDTEAVIIALKSGRIGYLALDVYEQEADLFFEDLSNEIIQDDVFQRLLTFPNVLVTGHQAFFTRNALANIADTTLGNITDFEQGRPLVNRISTEHLSP
jgi:D-lactate dehydrogenase